MQRLRPKFFTALAGLAVAAALWVGWRSFAAHREWQAMRPGLPAEVGASAPGLDARLAACQVRLQAWPPDRLALAEFARLCHANGLLPEASTGYQALMRLEPNEARWPHLLASILAGYGRLDEALPLHRRVTALAPDYLAGWLRLGEALFKGNATAEAAAAYQEALRRAPGNPYALLGLARCDLQLDRWTAARSHLQQAVAVDPKFADAQSLLASVFERLGNPAGAATARSRLANDGHYTEPPDAWSDELTAWCHNPYTLLVTASAASAAGVPARARPLLERALALVPDDPRLHRQLSTTLALLGDAAGARSHLERAVALAPADENLQLNLVALLRSAKDSAALERAVAAGLAACPGSAGLHYEAGLQAAAAGRWDEAERHFEFSWKNRPDQPAAAMELAKIRFRSDRTEAGVALVEKILNLEPRNATLHLMLVRHGISTADPRTETWLRRALDTGEAGPQLAELQQAFQRRFGRDIP